MGAILLRGDLNDFRAVISGDLGLWEGQMVVSKCSATLASVAAPPPLLGADRVSEVQTTCNTPRRWQCYTPPPKNQDKCYSGVWDGCDRRDTQERKRHINVDNFVW